jgi:hypothetical protein
MTQAKWCEGCSQAHDCKRVYQQTGDLKGPSVAGKAVVAFALPMGLFVAALGVLSRLLQHVVARPYRTLSACVLALSATMGIMLIVSHITKRLDRKRC